jgi:hypothetical protein
MRLADIAGGMASPKGLRHGFAVACLAAKIPLTTVQKWLGHARLETTAIYLDVSGEEEQDLAQRLWQPSVSADQLSPKRNGEPVSKSATHRNAAFSALLLSISQLLESASKFILCCMQDEDPHDRMQIPSVRFPSRKGRV